MNKTDIFNEAKWARIRAFNNGEKFNMGLDPVLPNHDGTITCLPAGQRIWQIGFEWDQPRDIRGVNFRFADEFDGNMVSEMYVQYWQFAWPTANPDRYSGARRGWLPVDDHFNGRWVEAYGAVEVTKESANAHFDHVDLTEINNTDFYSSKDFNAEFRRTLKLKVVFVCEKPPIIAEYEVIGNRRLRHKECGIYFCATEHPDGIILSADDISIWNGEISDISLIGNNGFKISYTATVGAQCAGDVTVLQFANGEYSFGVSADDIDSGVYMEDFDLLISNPLNSITPAEKVRTLTEGKRSIFERVHEHEEQTIANAFKEIPEMDVTKQAPYGRYVILGFDGLRKKFCLRYNGDIFADKILQKCSMRDVSGTRWAGAMLHFRTSTGDPPVRRESKNSCRQYMPDAEVPVYVTEWTDREIEYTQTTFATIKDRTLISSFNLRGDEDIVVMNRIELRNASADKRTAHLYIDTYPGEKLALNGDMLVAKGRIVPGDTVNYGWAVQDYNNDYVRLCIKKKKGTLSCIPMLSGGIVPDFAVPGEYDTYYNYDGPHLKLNSSSAIPNALYYEVELEGYEKQIIDFVIPYDTPIETDDIVALATKDFEAQLKPVKKFWQNFYSRAAKIKLPGEKHLNDFIKAVPWHIAMTAMRDPKTGNYIVPAATYSYRACGNEACMQIRLMDYLGYHDYAEKYLENYVNSQGVLGLEGNFKSKEGSLAAVNFDVRPGNEEFDYNLAYNLDHGFILSCFADHYMLTGDKKWLSRVSKTLVDGCDFVFREREATKVFDANGDKVPYYGLLPHGHLEDNREWRCWFAVNGHACGGILRVAKALLEINHPDAERILDEGIKYRDDIRASLIRAMSKSPAVPSGNGGYIPHLPTHAEIRGRDWGWFREAAYGPLHLVYGLVLDPNEQLTTWILRDLEDNLFISRNYGRIADKEKYWFSHGGITIQSNLLFNDMTYLERNEPERAIRALFNNFAQNLYRDINCFTEHPVPEFGTGVGPFFKTPDEAQFLIFLRNHLMRESENKILILQGASRSWFAKGESVELNNLASTFGPVSLRTTADTDEMTVTVSSRWRKVPESISVFFRRPDMKSPIRVTVNGNQLESSCIKGDEIIINYPAEELDIRAEYQI